jgi:oligoribonuclease (3'-5' exoribonuclease)
VNEFAFAFLDCEFGGLDPELHDITEVGLIVTDYRLAELGSREWKVRARPDRITQEAAELQGYDATVWAAEALPVRQVLTEIAALLPKDKKVVPAGQNVRMDVMFLERAFRACELAYPFDYHVIDLATLYYAWSLVAGETVQALSLRQAATAAGLVQGPVAHRALADARLTLETFRHYVGRLAPRRSPEDALSPVPVELSGSTR